MNSSLLVPALFVVAITAGVFVFGEGLFSGGSSEEVSKHSVAKLAKVKTSTAVADVKASSSGGSDFSWDDEPADGQSPVETSAKSFVSTKVGEEAPGDLYGADFDSQTEIDADDEFSTSELGSNDSSVDAAVDDFAATVDEQAAPKQVADDLSDFFDSAPKSTESKSSTVRSSTANRPQATAAKAVDSANLDVAMASPKLGLKGVDAFDDFGAAPSDFTPAPRAKVNDKMKSVINADRQKPVEKKSEVAVAPTEGSGVISGALEPVKDSGSSEWGGAKNGMLAKTPARKFKITNPKETTLSVTLSVDGKQVTLKPDQSFVLQQHEGDVEVTFSRGGSFGFETKTLKNGHYRFTVSREAGWKLIN